MKRSNILDAQSDYIVIPVNLVGVAGAGLAKQWAEREPDMVEAYKDWCINYNQRPQQLKIGKYILVPTKNHWRDNSNLKNIRNQLGYLYYYMIPHYEMKSVAISAIGAGLGGLDVREVRALITTMAKGAELLYDVQTDYYFR